MTIRRLLAGLAGLALCVPPAFAAPAPNSVVTPQTPEYSQAQITNATGTGLVTIATGGAGGGANGSKVESILCSNTDTAGYSVQIWRVHSAVNYLIATVSVPASAGNVAGTPPVQLITTAAMPGPVDGAGNRYLAVASGDTIQLGVTVAVTAGKTISCGAHQVDF